MTRFTLVAATAIAALTGSAALAQDAGAMAILKTADGGDAGLSLIHI